MSSAALSLAYQGSQETAAHAQDNVLGIAWHDEAPAFSGQVAQIKVHMPLLEGLPAEVWRSAGPWQDGQCAGVRYRCDEGLMFACIQIEEGSQSLQEVAQSAYLGLLQAMRQAGFSHLVRCWNYMADINVDAPTPAGPLERYRLFNMGRAAAFESAAAALLDTASPSACALGTASGPFTVYALASRQAPLNVENPRQVSAYAYPERYGPKSPTFSRASVLRLAASQVLFISGTASIVGHESVHRGDVLAQTQESLRNIAVLIEAAGFSAAALHYKAFVRHVADYPLVARAMREALGAEAPIVFLQADVCRAELLVEIEATGFMQETV